MTSPWGGLRRVLALTGLSLVLGAAGCGGATTDADIDCARKLLGGEKSPCTVTFERGEGKARAVVLGTEFVLVQVNEETDQITFEIEGTPLTVRTDASEVQTATSPLFSIKSVDRDKVVVTMSDSSEV